MHGINIKIEYYDNLFNNAIMALKIFIFEIS
jgi:hypothetical protein